MLDFGKPEYEVRSQYGNDYKHMTAESKKKWHAKVVGDSIEIRTSSMRVNTLVVVESDGTIRLLYVLSFSYSGLPKSSIVFSFIMKAGTPGLEPRPLG